MTNNGYYDDSSCDFAVWSYYIPDPISCWLAVRQGGMGGQHAGVLPRKLRISSAISAVFLLFVMSVVVSFTSDISLYARPFEEFFLWFMALYFGFGVIMNAISRSKIERIWSPYSAILCALTVILLV